MNSKSSMRTPLGKVRGLGTGRGATTAFWYERLTGAAMLVLTIAFVFVVLSLWGADYAAARATVANPFVAIILLATVLVTVWHMKLGMQIIIEDYVHAEGLKVLTLMANTFFSAILGLAGVFAILKIAFGG